MKEQPEAEHNAGVPLGQGDADGGTPCPREEVVILSDIPDKHPNKTAIEDRLQAAVTRFHGPWRVEVLSVGSGSWWLVCVERPTDGFRSTILFPPWNQEPEQIWKGVGRLLADA